MNLAGHTIRETIMIRILRQALLTMAASTLLAPAAVAQDAPAINDIRWYQLDSYCTFMRADHEFVYDDPETWTFVFFTNFPNEAGAEIFSTGFMRIDGALREFRFVSRETSGEGEAITMATSDEQPMTATINLSAGAKGEEATGYTGTIDVTRGDKTASVAFSGSCGV